MERSDNNMDFIEWGIDIADDEGRLIDEDTARRIASLLHTGQASAYYAFASSGHIDRERLAHEIQYDLNSDMFDGTINRWLGKLALFVEAQGE